MTSSDAFIESVRRAILGDDADAYVALFDLPAGVYRGGPTDLRRDAGPVRAAHARIERIHRAYDAIDWRAEPVAERPFGRRLLVLRRMTRLLLADADETDAHEELWVLREREEDGALRLVAAVNSLASYLDAGGAREAPPPEGAAAAAFGPFLAACEATLNDRDPEAHAALLDVPFLRISDDATDATASAEENVEICRRCFVGVDAAGVGRVRLAPLSVRPYGDELVVARVSITLGYPDGDEVDPNEELWILRYAEDRLRLGAIVNPFAPRLIAADPTDGSPA